MAPMALFSKWETATANRIIQRERGQVTQSALFLFEEALISRLLSRNVREMSSKDYRTLIPVFDELRDEQVIVRPHREEDAQAMFEAMEEAREYIRPWLSFADAHQTVEEARDWIIQSMASWLLREGLMVGIWDAKTQHYIGGSWINPHNWELGYFELGYWLRPSAAGHGYMTAVVKLLTDYAFKVWNANRVEIRCDERNKRSIAVATRLGFTYEGRLRNVERAFDGHLRNMLIFALIPEDKESSGTNPT